jgi:uncharacterized OsmC-like protein
MDCPYTGKGEELSPKELVGAGLASCMLISMGTLAMRSELDITGTRVEVDIAFETDKANARISAIELMFNMPQNFSAKDRTKLERAAAMCPIEHSFHPDIPISVRYYYPE